MVQRMIYLRYLERALINSNTYICFQYRNKCVTRKRNRKFKNHAYQRNK